MSDDYDLVWNKTCRVELQIKIYSLVRHLNPAPINHDPNTAFLSGKDENDNKEKKLKFLEHNCGNFIIVGQDQVIGTTRMKKYFGLFNGKAGRKEYYVDKDLIIKESSVLKSMTSTKGKGSTKIVLPDTNTQTLEAFLIFCYTGNFIISAILNYGEEILCTFQRSC